MRYHPAIVAQAFATMGAMYPGRVGIGVGTGEPPNEMAIYGAEWPSNNTRFEMLEEALVVMNLLWTSDEPVRFAGKYYTLNDAILLTKPEEKVPVYVSAIGPRAANLAGRLGDHLITIANHPQYVAEELLPALEAGAREAGKDPAAMERVGHFSVRLRPGSGGPARERAAGCRHHQRRRDVEGLRERDDLILHDAEDFIRKIEEMGRMGITISRSPTAAWRSWEAIARLWTRLRASRSREEVLPHVQ